MSNSSQSNNEPRPDFIRHVTEMPSSGFCYPGDTEQMSVGSPLSRPLGLKRLGIHHELLEPGVRTSWPHAEEQEEEFIFVLEGTPDVWVDGELYRLKPEDCVAFAPGTGIAHTFINNTEAPVRLLVVGEYIPGNRIYYPFHPTGWAGMVPKKGWSDVPKRPLGPHDGMSDKKRGDAAQE